MKETTLYLIRHSETTFNKKKVYYGKTDCPLSERGIIQSKILKEKLKDEKFELVVSSPLKRCIDTALIITGFKEQDILKFNDFRELNFGLWEGLNYEEIAEKYPKDWDLWKRDWKNGQPTKGENFMNMYKRVIKTLTSFLQNCTGEKVLIVSHKGCLQIIASYLLTKDENLFWNFDFQQGKYSVFEIKEGFCVIKKINC